MIISINYTKSNNIYNVFSLLISHLQGNRHLRMFLLWVFHKVTSQEPPLDAVLGECQVTGWHFVTRLCFYWTLHPKTQKKRHGNTRQPLMSRNTLIMEEKAPRESSFTGID